MLTPHGAYNRARCLAVRAGLRRRGVQLGPGSMFSGRPVVRLAPGSTVQIGARFVATSSSRYTALGVAHPVVLRTVRPGAVIRIGADVGISGATVCSAYRVCIGAGCLLGADVTIMDTDFHPIDHPARRYAAPPVPLPEDAVEIGRNVFVGTRAVILRGTRIGDDAVVGAGAVVRGRIDAGSVVVGNPARVVRSGAVSAVDGRA